jgi:hypothetical protein
MLHKPAGIVCALIVCLTAACAPVYQDARIVRPGQVEITPSISPIFITSGGDTEHVGTQLGAHAIFGAADRVDFGIGYARFEVDDEAAGGTNVLGFGPRYGLVRGRLTAAAPVGFAFGGGADAGDSFQVQPALLFTTPIGQNADFNPSVRLLVPFCDGCDTMVGFNFGLGLGSRTGQMRVRPEIGFVVNPGERGVTWSFGLGVSFRARTR